MRVRFFGVRGSCPCSSDEHRRYGGNTSCTTVEVGEEAPIILDLGTGLRPLGLALLAEDRLRGSHRQVPGGSSPGWTALLTHLHWDHLIGLPFFPPVLVPGQHLDVYGPQQETGSIQDVVDSVVKPPFFPVQVHELHGSIAFHDIGDSTLTIGSARIMARRIPHVGSTLGFRIEAGGASVAYLSDHQAPPDMRSVDPAVLELCHGVDLLIHDGQYTGAEFVDRADWGHSTPEYAVHVAAEAGVGTLALFHHDPLHTDEDIDRLVASAAALPEAAALRAVVGAAEGMAIDVAAGAVQVVRAG